MKLDRGLARDRHRAARGSCAAAVRACPRWRPRAAARAGLSGIEFGVNIPGTVGGAVRMNANAYGGELARVLEWVRDRHRRRRRAPRAARSSASATAARASRPGRSSRAPACCSRRGPRRRSRRRSREMRARRHEAQPQGIRTFGSTFKNPEDPRAQGRSAGMLLRRGRLQRPGRRRRALRPQARQLHREHRRGHDRGRARRDGRGPPPRARALRRGARARGADARAMCAFPGRSAGAGSAE